MLTITKPQVEAIRAQVQTHTLSHGIGTAESMCSVAAINIAMTGRVTDDCPDCMSPVIHKWIVLIQDFMPIDMINAPEWLALLPFAAGTGRNHEAERVEIIMDWMWGTVLPQLQPTADLGGFGEEWRAMCKDRTAAAEWAAWAAAAMAAEWAAEWAAWAAAAEWAAAAYWPAIDPADLLRRLITVSVTADEMAV